LKARAIACDWRPTTPDGRGPSTMAPSRPSRRPLKKLQLVKSPRTARPANSPAPPRHSRPVAQAAGPGSRHKRTYDAQTVRDLAAAERSWPTGPLAQATAKAPLRRPEFATDSGIPIPAVITAADRRDEEP